MADALDIARRKPQYLEEAAQHGYVQRFWPLDVLERHDVVKRPLGELAQPAGVHLVACHCEHDVAGVDKGGSH